MQSFDAISRSSFLLAALCALTGMCPLKAQQTTPTLPSQTVPPVLPGSPGNRTGAGNTDEDNPMARQMAEQQVLKRNTQRQKLIVDDTARLLQLAQQLKEQVDKGKGADFSNSFTKKAEEIERLAKTVKEKMREGQ
jgi:hypothetical protein